MNENLASPKLKDLWTDDRGYRESYQTDGDVDTILKLLDLPHAAALVDVGCGNGAFAVAAASKFPACRVWAFDALESAIDECRRRAGALPRRNLTAGVAWANTMPLPAACADRALCRSVLHHVADPGAVFREIARVLQPGGRLVLQTPCNFWEPQFSAVLSGMMAMIDDSHRRFFYGPAELIAGLEQAGFRAGEPECWTYTFPYLDDAQAAFVREHRGEQRLNLRPIEGGKWSIENYWARIVATKGGA